MWRGSLRSQHTLQLLTVIIHAGSDTPSGWWRSVPDEGGFPGGVLAHQQHHGLALEVGRLQGRGVEVMEEVSLLQRQQLLGVQSLQSLRHRLVHLSLLVASTLLLVHPAEHADRPLRSNFPVSIFPNVPAENRLLLAECVPQAAQGECVCVCVCVSVWVSVSVCLAPGSLAAMNTLPPLCVCVCVCVCDWVWRCLWWCDRCWCAYLRAPPFPLWRSTEHTHTHTHTHTRLFIIRNRQTDCGVSEYVTVS